MTITSSLLAVSTPNRDPYNRHERGCDPVSCEFTVARVRVYLICWRQAAIHHESFESVFGSSCKSSYVADPWNKGRGANSHAALDIRIALEQARDTGGLALVEWNAERIARWLCRNEHQEPAVDPEDFERL